MKYRYEILSKKEKDIILSDFFSENDIITDFSLTISEIDIIKKFNKPYISLGYAIQLLFLKNRGISVLSSYDLIPESIIINVAQQINSNSKTLTKYWKIKNTKFRHFQEISQMLSYNKFEITPDIEKFAYKTSISTGCKLDIVRIFIGNLKSNKIIIPNLYKIEELISKSISLSDEFIYKKICDQIQSKNKLDTLLNNEENGNSSYSRIKNISVNTSSNGVKEILKIIKELDTYGKTIDLNFLSDLKIKYLNNEIQRSDRFRIQRFHNYNKKYSYLAMFIYFKRKEFIDMVVESTSKYASTVLKRSKNKSQKNNLKKQEKYKTNSEKLKLIVKSIFAIEDFETFKEYKNSLKELKTELDLQEDDLDEVDFLLKSHQSIDYINNLLETIQFDSNTKPEFIKCLKDFKSQKNKKKVKIDIKLFDTKWQKYIKKYEYGKKIVDIALLYTIRDYIRSGDLFIRESRKYNSFDYYLIEPLENINDIEATSLLNTLKSFIQIPKQIEFSRDIEQDEKSIFSDRVYSYFPKTTMTEILYEVNLWTGILENFKEPSKNLIEEQKALVATLLANGHNLGFSKMAIASSINESTLRRTSECYLNYENLSRAQKNLVNYHHSLEIVSNWGNGQSSSSDGMRVPINSRTIYADYNAHYGNKGGGIYRHVSDQYTPYYVQMLEGRDSNHVLDGLLSHGTSLEIHNHSTDTAGYTEQMFALTYLLGFEFKPRIKNLDQQQLYAFENIEIDNVKFKKINEKNIIENYHEVIRLVESIRCGKVKASLILQKINSYNRDNGIVKGLKEIGRIIKTNYILDYYTNGELRKEVQKMLNKGESINSVARLIFFGKNGRLNETRLEGQLEKVSCLNVLLGSLIVWNSRYLEKVYNTIKNEDWFSAEEFKRVSPLGTVHVNFLGRYAFEDVEIYTDDGLRPLEIKD